ncbi:hypothetical protein [Pseudoxanthomonas suwonensis]|uniref:hypothetical protein n=1 Tax=Pseudoxanthomonas suwonensis TaxID=314722 RepID=UPI0012DC1A4A|nr:hypothetical protein [Pseudoxanthomonas suwonensis]
MGHDTIVQVEIDGEGRLHVVPSAHSLPFIYREGMEVQWDPVKGSLYSPKPREWPYSRWFQQVLAAASSQGCDLRLASDTRWVNIAPGIKAELLQVSGNEAYYSFKPNPLRGSA